MADTKDCDPDDAEVERYLRAVDHGPFTTDFERTQTTRRCAVGPRMSRSTFSLLGRRVRTTAIATCRNPMTNPMAFTKVACSKREGRPRAVSEQA